MTKMRNKSFYFGIKRIFDFLCAAVLIVVLALPMLVVSVFIKLEDGGPIIYKSKRVGKNLKKFYVYKFRSMRVDRKELKSGLSHEEAVTRVGKFIRKTSLDEIPQLFNILKGEMSFIGPRPWIPEYYKFFTDEQCRRAEVLPGISGLAQVRGRNNVSIFNKIKYDLVYIEKASFIFDLRIIFMTIKAVIKKTGAEITEAGIISEIRALEDKNGYAIEESVLKEDVLAVGLERVKIG